MGHISLTDLSQLELPAPPQSLAKISSMLDGDEVNMLRMSQFIETDLSLAAAVMKTVNSPLYGLRGRANHVHQAVTFLGTREIAALVYQVSLRRGVSRCRRIAADVGALGRARTLDGAAGQGDLHGRLVCAHGGPL